MKNYLSSKLKDVLEAPLLLENNFTKLFDEFEIIEKNNIINSINSNKKINNIFLEDNNNNLNKEIFISFGKNKINNQDFSPIPILSSDSQKNKFSINSDKIQDNSLSPIPMNNLNLPIIKDINSHDSNQNYKNNIPPLFKKNSEEFSSIIEPSIINTIFLFVDFNLSLLFESYIFSCLA